MTPFLRGMIEATVRTFKMPGPIVEVGSYHVPGQEQLIDLRQLFAGQSYVGIDMRAGPGVDRVENVERMTMASRSVGTVVALSTLEHVRRFWLGMAELKRILRPDGVMILSTPFHFHIHNHPSDYWRFTPEALDSLLDDQFPQRILGHQGPDKRPSNTWAIAFGPDYPTISVHQIEQYQQELERLASTPRKMVRTWRYRLASLIAGSRPFDHYLKQDQFKLEVRRGVQSESLAA